MQHTSSSTTLALALALALAPTAAHAYASWTPWVSEENGGPWAWCASTYEAANGFDCNGNDCDQVALRCDTIPYGITVQSYTASEFFSEEDSGVASVTSEGWYRHDDSFSHVCYRSHAAGIMTGIRCQGSHCDQISVECALPMTHFQGVSDYVDLVDCEWTDYVSEEDPPLQLAYGHFITGVSCHGSRCDDKSFYVCRVQGPENSCMGECGGQARGCWCDDMCSTYGDCCSDYEDVCIPF